MSLVIRRIALENFRKFRERREIAGLTAGLNVVIEGNEAGKSTLLEALRAALFLKHGSKTQLITSFQPHGDEVAPEVEVDFGILGPGESAEYTLKKRFISRTMAELSTPAGRSQNAEAEDQLQRLLGFEQGRGFDNDLSGALGMLWVAQTEGLAVTPPGGKVRDLIGATIESEAGTILGSVTFQRVSARVETQFRRFFTDKGQVAKAGLQGLAEQRLAAATEAVREAEQQEQKLEAAFADLDQARRQLATLRRELDDRGDADERADLERKLETARGAAALLARRQLEASAASAKLVTLEDLQTRHAHAQARHSDAEDRRAAAQEQRAGLADALELARQRVVLSTEALAHAREEREAARTALVRAQAHETAQRHRAGLIEAHARHAQVISLEARRAALLAEAPRPVPQAVLDDLDEAEREAMRHRALLDAEGTHVELTGPEPGLTRDGKALAPGTWTLTRDTRIGLPGGSELVLRPPQALAGAQAALDACLARRGDLLAEWQLESLADARARNEAAHEAGRSAETLTAHILAAAPADRDLGLAAGVDALKVFVAANPLEPEAVQGDALPVAEAEAAREMAEAGFVRAETLHAQASEDLRGTEKADTPLTIAEQSATNEAASAAEDIARIAAHAQFAYLDATLPSAREEAAGAAVALGEARDAAAAFDEDALRRRIDALGKRRKAAEDARTGLALRIAGLEARVESEGGKGLAEHAAATREELAGAKAALARIVDEAATLRLLRETLAEAQAETARTITGPVATRAAHYVGRVLQGAEPAFGEDLGLAAIRRAGMDEACEQLSRGTQEQLAMLTRLAFADMLLEEGRPVSLILDDPLVYSDDVRLDAMMELIAEASRRMQVILLTCRERAFRHVEGNRVRL